RWCRRRLEPCRRRHRRLHRPAGSLLVRTFWRSFDSRAGRAGLIMFSLIVGLALFAPALAPKDPFQQSIVQRLRPPAWQERGTNENLLGTDQLGRDILSRLIYGSRISLIVGAAAVVGAGLLGAGLGLAAGYF